jgi:hypothetical protein
LRGCIYVHSSTNTIRIIKSRRRGWAGYVARIEETINEYRILVGNHKKKRPLGRPRRRWEDNVEIDLRGGGCCDVDWIHLAQDKDQWRALVNMVTNLPISQNFGKFLSR